MELMDLQSSEEIKSKCLNMSLWSVANSISALSVLQTHQYIIWNCIYL